MHRLIIGVSPYVFELFGSPRYKYSLEEQRIMNSVEQQTFILSDKIIKYYQDSAERPDIINAIIEARGNIEGTIQFFNSEKYTYSSGAEELIGLVEKVEQKVLVAERSDIKQFSAKKINLVSPKKLGEGKETILSKYTFPCIFHVTPNLSCDIIADWFKILFMNEKKLIIYDKYLLTTAGLDSFKKYYLPIIEKTTEVIIYCSMGDMARSELVKNAKNPCFDSHNIIIYLAQRMSHDRYIETSHLRIAIGAGLDLLNVSGKVSATKECEISVKRIDDGEHISVPRAEKIR